MINTPYIDEEDRVVLPDLPDDYEQVMQDTCDLMHPGGSLEQRYEAYHDMAINCDEEPISFDEWLAR